MTMRHIAQPIGKLPHYFSANIAVDKAYAGGQYHLNGGHLCIGRIKKPGLFSVK